MSSTEFVAVIALVVSLVALIIAVTQLLQQIFGTAEGYRRCQNSVIGPWSRLRHRKIRWSELRMETQFMTPDLFLLDDHDRKSKQTEIYEFRHKDNSGLVPSRSSFQKGQVGWLGLMTSLRDLEQNHDTYRSSSTSTLLWKPSASMCRRYPVFQPLPQSWDLMPPDVVRPLATTTLGQILVIAHRLGMDWSVVRPSEGRLHAEGHGQSLTSLEIRSVGLALQYTDKDPQREKTEDYFTAPREQYFTAPLNHINGSRSLNRLFIPTREADKMAFGFIPADPILGTKEYCLAGGYRKFEGIQDTMLQLKVDWKAIEYCTRGAAGQNFFSDRFKSPVWNGISDAIYLLSPWLPLAGTGAVRVRLPHHSDLQTPLNWREGHVVFWLRLKELIASMSPISPQLRRVSQDLETLATRYPDNFIHLDNLPHRWKSNYDSSLTTEEALKFIKTLYDDAISFLKDRTFPYTALVAAHIEMAVEVHKQVLSMPEKQRRKCDVLSGFYYTWMVEQAHQYIDHFDTVVSALRKKSPNPVEHDDVQDAWWTMILKGIAWKFSIQPHGHHASHFYAPIASHFWESELPIYLM